MVGRGDVTATAWATLAPLLPTNGGRGQLWRDHRHVRNGILGKLQKAARGAICRSAMGRGRPSITIFGASGSMGPGSRSPPPSANAPGSGPAGSAR